MGLRFRPYPGFTIAAVIMTAILIGLGVWQIAAPALEAGADRHSESQYDGRAGLRWTVLALSRPMTRNIARVALEGRFDNAKEAYVFTTDAGGDAGLSCADAVHDR